MESISENFPRSCSKLPKFLLATCKSHFVGGWVWGPPPHKVIWLRRLCGGVLFWPSRTNSVLEGQKSTPPTKSFQSNDFVGGWGSNPTPPQSEIPKRPSKTFPTNLLKQGPFVGTTSHKVVSEKRLCGRWSRGQTASGPPPTKSLF